MTGERPTQPQLPWWLVGATALALVAIVLTLTFGLGSAPPGATSAAAATSQFVAAVNADDPHDADGVTCKAFRPHVHDYIDRMHAAHATVSPHKVAGRSGGQALTPGKPGANVPGDDILFFATVKQDGGWFVCTGTAGVKLAG